MQFESLRSNAFNGLPSAQIGKIQSLVYPYRLYREVSYSLSHIMSLCTICTTIVGKCILTVFSLTMKIKTN